MQQLEKKNVLITGSGRGIGKRLAIGFAQQGANVGLLARSRAELELTQLEIQQAGGSAIRLRADVCNYAQLRAAADRMRANLGEIHALVCAAGSQGPVGPIWEASPKTFAVTVETNILGVMNAVRAILPHMIEHRSGKIIVLSGGGSIRPRPHFAPYAATKAALLRFVESVAEEVREHNIQINCLGPGSTYTHMTDQILKAGDKAGWKESEEALKVRMTGGALAEDQIQLALFLASEESNHVNGKMIHIRDDWRRLLKDTIHPELYTLRRVRKV